MAKKSSKIALTYFVTIIITLIVIGGVCYMLMMYILDPAPNDDNIQNIDPMLSAEENIPSDDNNKTTLIIFDSEKRMSGCCFMAVRTIASERRIKLIPIPADTYAKVDGTENSVYEFYRTSGSKKAVKAVENALDIDIDYYLKLNNESFSTMVSIFGSIEVSIPYNLIYTDPDTKEETIYREGTVFADSGDLRKILTYPLYNSGEEYRAKMVGIAAADLINKNVVSGFSSHIDNYFSAVINSQVDTNFTAYDYAEQSDTLKYIADSSGNIANLITVTGEYNDDSLFVLEKGFVKLIPEWFGINADEE